ncbi:unnamed protein product [Prunus armeniaca]
MAAETAAQPREKSNLNQSLSLPDFKVSGRDFGWFRFGASRRVERDRSRGLRWPDVAAGWRFPSR